MDTIYALSTAWGPSGVAVIRASGPHAIDGLCRLTKGSVSTTYITRQTYTRTFYHPEKGTTLDYGLVIVFRAPASFTGEDVVEYHVHGGTAVIKGILEALSFLPTHRLAQPGEFTRRAFENGKMDLTAAEAIADLIHAETEGQKQQALLQMDGALFRLYTTWKDRIAGILALMEADLDFSDQDLPDEILLTAKPDIAGIHEAIHQHLNDANRGEILRDGFHIVIMGEPNAGKSSLLNALARRDVAIVSPIAGTTRDMIDVHLNLGGYAVVLTDTAGLRDAELDETGQGTIEMEGIKRALERAKKAHLRLFLYDGTKPFKISAAMQGDEGALYIANKADSAAFSMVEPSHIAISAQNGTGLDVLLARIQEHIKIRLGRIDMGAPPLTRARHREALTLAAQHLERGMSAELPELVAEDLRLALRALGSLTGHVDIEELLDMIFRDFCIGK